MASFGQYAKQVALSTTVTLVCILVLVAAVLIAQVPRHTTLPPQTLLQGTVRAGSWGTMDAASPSELRTTGEGEAAHNGGVSGVLTCVTSMLHVPNLVANLRFLQQTARDPLQIHVWWTGRANGQLHNALQTVEYAYPRVTLVRFDTACPEYDAHYFQGPPSWYIALFHCPLRHVLFLSPDTALLQPPDALFRLRAYRDTGLVVFPDFEDGTSREPTRRVLSHMGIDTWAVHNWNAEEQRLETGTWFPWAAHDGIFLTDRHRHLTTLHIALLVALNYRRYLLLAPTLRDVLWIAAEKAMLSDSTLKYSRACRSSSCFVLHAGEHTNTNTLPIRVHVVGDLVGAIAEDQAVVACTGVYSMLQLYLASSPSSPAFMYRTDHAYLGMTARHVGDAPRAALSFFTLPFRWGRELSITVDPTEGNTTGGNTTKEKRTTWTQVAKPTQDTIRSHLTVMWDSLISIPGCRERVTYLHGMAHDTVWMWASTEARRYMMGKETLVL